MSSLSEETKNIGENSNLDLWGKCLKTTCGFSYVLTFFLYYLSELIEAGVFLFLDEELKHRLNPSFG